MTKVKELESQVQELQKQVDAMQSRQQHASKTHFIRWTDTPAEAQELEALTEEEQAFLLQHGRDKEQAVLSFSIHMRKYTAEELSALKAMLEQLKNKRCVGVTWYD